MEASSEGAVNRERMAKTLAAKTSDDQPVFFSALSERSAGSLTVYMLFAGARYRPAPPGKARCRPRPST